jgi:hypothetical protein
MPAYRSSLPATLIWLLLYGFWFLCDALCLRVLVVRFSGFSPQRHQGTKGRKDSMQDAIGTSRPVPLEGNAAAREVMDGVYRVHKALGPRLLESVYEVCLAHELTKCLLLCVP